MCAPEIGKNISILFRTPANETEQESGQSFEHYGLADDQEDGNTGVSVAMVLGELTQGGAQEVQDEKEVTDHEHGVDHQLDQECPQGRGCVLFHYNLRHIIIALRLVAGWA
jgi:hypothetical protein